MPVFTEHVFMSNKDDRLKGRGAVSNASGRFEPFSRESFDDGWGTLDEELPPLKTQVRMEPTRTIITRNDSPDVPFDRSLNPYKGCEHGCVYCADGETPILMASGGTRPLAELQPGDEIYGTRREGGYRRYTKARVLAHWQTEKPAFRITLEDGTTLIASGDHRFLTARGWKFVTDTAAGIQRAHLTTNDKLMGIGALGPAPAHDDAYMRGYLCGMIRGDGEGLDRSQRFLEHLGVETHRASFQVAAPGYRPMEAIRSGSGATVARVRELVAWPDEPALSWSRGFLGGLFDAEGSFSQGVLRISNTDESIISQALAATKRLGFDVALETPERGEGRPIRVIRLRGGLGAQLRFLQTVDPAIDRKRSIEGAALKSDAALRVVDIEPLPARPLYDITTSTEDFIANGVVSHNCFARPTHAYLGLSPGLDFETRLVAKPEAPLRLRQELSRPGYRCDVLALGANTDPYQPVERELRITRGVLEVLRDFSHPVAIVTKSALVQRDLDILGPMAERRLAMVLVSITSLDRKLARRLEPRAAAPERRLETVRALAQAGVPVGVLSSPVIPAVNDAELEAILEAAHAAGARSAGYVLVRLPHEIKDLFAEWLEKHLPERKEHVLNLIRDTREGALYQSQFGKRMAGTGAYAEALKQRFRLACMRLGLNRHELTLDTTRFAAPGPKQLGLFGGE